MAEKKGERPWVPKQMFWSAAGMAVLVLMGGFWGLGWVTNGSAEDMAEKAAKKAVFAHLVPFCVLHAKESLTADADIAALKKESSWKRNDFVKAKGWATMPGEDEPVRGVADRCVEEILKG